MVLFRLLTKAAYSWEVDHSSWRKAITVPAMPISGSERSDAGEMIVGEVIGMGQAESAGMECRGRGGVEPLPLHRPFSQTEVCGYHAWSSGLGRWWRFGLFGFYGFGFAHRIAVQLDAVGVVNESVKDAVGQGGIADLFVPFGHGQLRGEDGGARLIAVFGDFPEVAAFAFVHGSHSPVVDDQHIDAAESR